MRAVITATDFIKNPQGEFKAIENNTNVAVAVWDISRYINSDVLTAFLTTNSITEITVALPHSMSFQNDTIPVDGSNSFISFARYLQDNYENIVTTSVTADSNNQVQDWTDGEGKLLVRFCYDENALLDETYAKDNFEFLKIMHSADSTSIPKTYFNDGSGLSVDSLGDTLNDNGVLPNYIIKLRYPTIDYAQYPKVLKVASLMDLEALKVGLQGNEILQEYIVNTGDLEDGKAKTYRKLDFIYGSNLDSLDFCQAYFLTNHVALEGSVDYQANGEVAGYERVRFIQRIGNTKNRVEFFNPTKIRMDDGTTKIGENVLVGDVVDAVQLAHESGSKGTSLGRAAGLLSNSSYASAEVIDKGVYYGNTLTVNITTATNNYKIPINSKILGEVIINKVDPNGYDYTEADVYWRQGRDFIVGDTLVISRNGTELTTEAVTGINYSIEFGTAYSLDVEDIDHFFVASNTASSVDSLVMHNKEIACFCWETEEWASCTYSGCIGQTNCGNSGPGQQSFCSSNTPTCWGYPVNQVIGECGGPPK
jgi:hypothetical protein